MSWRREIDWIVHAKEHQEAITHLFWQNCIDDCGGIRAGLSTLEVSGLRFEVSNAVERKKVGGFPVGEHFNEYRDVRVTDLEVPSSDPRRILLFRCYVSDVYIAYTTGAGGLAKIGKPGDVEWPPYPSWAWWRGRMLNRPRLRR